MLPGLTLPASWRSLLDVFRPAFRRGSGTFALFALLAPGWRRGPPGARWWGCSPERAWPRRCRSTRRAGSSPTTPGTLTRSGWCWPG